jgi:hypothetical protein
MRVNIMFDTHECRFLRVDLTRNILLWFENKIKFVLELMRYGEVDIFVKRC